MSTWHSLRTQAAQRWQSLSPREQHSLSLLGGLLAILLLGSIAIAPALNTLHDSDNRRAHMGQQHAHMLALQAQAQALQTRTPLSRDEALRHLQSLTPGALMQLNVQGDRVMVQLKAVPAASLANWLTQARSQAQALPIEAHLTRDNTGMTWNGSVVLSLPK